MHIWTLQDAKAKFSELVNLCLQEGPQEVTRHGRPAVVVVPYQEYQALVRPQGTLKDFFLSAPRGELPIDRDQSLPIQILNPWDRTRP